MMVKLSEETKKNFMVLIQHALEFDEPKAPPKQAKQAQHPPRRHGLKSQPKGSDRIQ